MDILCVRFFTCPLPVLVICWHTLDMMLTRRWRHHIGIQLLSLETVQPPVCLYQCFISSFLPSNIFFPAYSFVSLIHSSHRTFLLLFIVLLIHYISTPSSLLHSFHFVCSLIDQKLTFSHPPPQPPSKLNLNMCYLTVLISFSDFILFFSFYK